MDGAAFYDYVLETFKRTDKETEVYNSINDVIDTLIQSYPFEDYKFASKQLQIAAIGDYTISLPTDFLSINGDITMKDNDLTKPLNNISREVFQEKHTDIYSTDPKTSYPNDFNIYGNLIYLGPVPDSASYVYFLDYSIKKTTVTSVTGTVPFTNLNRKMMKHLVLASLYNDLEEFDLADKHAALGAAQYQILTDREQKNVHPFVQQQYRDM